MTASPVLKIARFPPAAASGEAFKIDGQSDVIKPGGLGLGLALFGRIDGSGESKTGVVR